MPPAGPLRSIGYGVYVGVLLGDLFGEAFTRCLGHLFEARLVVLNVLKRTDELAAELVNGDDHGVDLVVVLAVWELGAFLHEIVEPRGLGRQEDAATLDEGRDTAGASDFVCASVFVGQDVEWRLATQLLEQASSLGVTQEQAPSMLTRVQGTAGRVNMALLKRTF